MPFSAVLLRLYTVTPEWSQRTIWGFLLYPLCLSTGNTEWPEIYSSLFFSSASATLLLLTRSTNSIPCTRPGGKMLTGEQTLLAPLIDRLDAQDALETPWKPPPRFLQLSLWG